MESIQKHFFSDIGVMFGRSMRHILRSMDTIITVTIMPIAFMLLFVYVFGGAIQSGTDNYVNYLLPGILLMAIASGISYTAYRLFIDMQRGIFERLHSMPIARSTIAGLSAKSVDGASAFSYPILFLPFISSAFVPTKSMPPVVRDFAENQPVNSIVDVVRSLLAGQPVGNDIWIALAWCLGILVVAYVFAMRAYKRRIS